MTLPMLLISTLLVLICDRIFWNAIVLFGAILKHDQQYIKNILLLQNDNIFAIH